MNKYLPIGSIVVLKDGEKRLMIYGVKQAEGDTGETWDYVGCLFPEGNIDLEHTYIFNHDQIDKIYYLGLMDEEQYEFNIKIGAIEQKPLIIINPIARGSLRSLLAPLRTREFPSTSLGLERLG